MTDQTPIKRAAAAIDENYNPDQAPILAAMFQDYARAVFDSIDTDQLARVIHAWDVEGGPCEGPFEDLTDDQKAVWESAATTVKNWLTGKDTQ